MPRCLAYIRCSSLGGPETSLEAQTEHVLTKRDEVLAENPGLQWVGVFADEAARANRTKLRSRPHGLLLECNLREGDHLIVAGAAAFQSPADASHTLQNWAARGVVVHLLLDEHVDRLSLTKQIRRARSIEAADAKRRVGGAVAGVAPRGKRWVGPPGRRWQADDPPWRGVMALVVDLRDAEQLTWPAIGDAVEAKLATFEGRKRLSRVRSYWTPRVLQTLYEHEKAYRGEPPIHRSAGRPSRLAPNIAHLVKAG